MILALHAFASRGQPFQLKSMKPKTKSKKKKKKLCKMINANLPYCMNFICKLKINILSLSLHDINMHQII